MRSALLANLVARSAPIAHAPDVVPTAFSHSLGCKRPEDLQGGAGLMKELKIRLMERMLGAELTAPLDYEAGAEPPTEQTNRQNWVASKLVKGSDGEVPLVVLHDRDGSFEPESVKKGHLVMPQP